MRTKLLAILLFVILLAACAPAATPVPTSLPTSTSLSTFTPPPLTETPTSIPITSTPSVQQPPACTFPLAQTTTKEPKSGNYTFAEPYIVLTTPRTTPENMGWLDNVPQQSPDIVGWLPDNQNVLITFSKPHKFNGIDGSLQTIELFNLKTLKVQTYATRRDFGEKDFPTWNPAINAIIYSAPNVLGIDKTTNRFIMTKQMRISYGNPDDTQLLTDNLLAYSPTYYAMIKSDDHQVIYLKDDDRHFYQLYSRQETQGSLEKERLIPFDSEWFGHNEFPSFDMAWRSGTSQIFFYTDISSVNQSLLLDVNTGQVCSFSFGGWVYFARWSPNGRYLAMVTSKGSMHPIWVNYDLNVLDTLTGILYKTDSEKIGYPNLAHFVSDMAWGPDNYHLAIIGTSYSAGTSHPPPIDRLYLVNFLSGEADNLFPSYQLYVGRWGTGLAWSPDGSKILVKCSTEKEGRLCLISVGKVEP